MTNTAKDDFLRGIVEDLPTKVNIVDKSGNPLHTFIGNAKTNSIDIPQSQLGGGSGSTGGDSGDGSHPTVGADYYPGSVYDGTISGRTLLYSGVTSTTDKTNIVFPESVGAGLRLLGDGIQIRLKLLKTLVTRGVVDTSSTEIPLVYDILDKQVKGSFVTVAPLPASIKKEDILSGNELVIPLDGIGEGEQSAEVKSPELHLQYDSKTNSINVWNVQGYALDNLTDTKTGTFYDVQATLVNNFYVQDSVAQLPANMSLFTGDTGSEVSLTGTNEFLDNIGDKIRIDLEDYLYININNPTSTPQNTLERSLLSNFGIPNYFIFSKEDLISGYNIPMNVNVPSQVTSFSVQTQSTYSGNTSWSNTTWSSKTAVPVTLTSPSFLIDGSRITPMLLITFKTPIPNVYDDSRITFTGTIKITSIKTYKDGE